MSVFLSGDGAFVPQGFLNHYNVGITLEIVGSTHDHRATWFASNIQKDLSSDSMHHLPIQPDLDYIISAYAQFLL